MSRFDFGSLECEPSGMSGYYRVALDATGKGNFVMYAVPAELQTRTYAVATLSRQNGPELARLRADARLRREQTYQEAAVPRRAVTTAAALTNLHIAGREVLLEQLDAVQAAVEEDIAAGPASVLQVGIVPARYVQPLPENMPSNMSFNGNEDFGTFTTHDGVFVIGPDGFEVDRQGVGGVRGTEAQRRLDVLEHWGRLAVSGEAALDIIAQSRAAVLAA